MSALHKLVSCDGCGIEFRQKHSRHRVCGDKKCVTKMRSDHNYKWKVDNGILSGKPKDNLWSEDDKKFLTDNRFMSNKEISLAIGRSLDAIKEKRSRMGVPRLAKCESCGSVFKRINQHNQCESCTPNQQGYAKDYNNSLNGRWQMYKSGASKRNIPFMLTIQDFSKLWGNPCEYCGGEIKLIGIDRIDSTKGYTTDNIVACCARCNEMKNSSSKDGWINQMKKILNHLGETL